MKEVLTLFITLALLTSCSPFKATKSDEGLNCREYEKFIKIAWQYDKIEKIFVIQPNDLDFFLKHKTCLYDVDRDKVISLLGLPSINQENVLKYYLINDCNKKGRRRCKLLQIMIDISTNTVTDIRISGFTVHH